ncbi:hypothetical protein Q8791_23650 [Nocardiopsis sp. CT-R113]|uniref:Uncharacterized protein n=1 Tax=Nocardiopsis codii TaxID=3065942 RepID=A0ABU7KDA8_9ACTN|nr:hypothetical protein [Nocardiopsis sp. CT-R113]MEE2040215.1 hypothetical protein [Nocardiopsis sp. CT-R113]
MSTDDSMHAEYTTITRDTTATAYADLDRAATDLQLSTELVVAPGPVEDRDQAAAIRGWFEARDDYRAAELEAARYTCRFAMECEDAELEFAEEFADITDRPMVDHASEAPEVPEFWPPREGDVWAVRDGSVWTVRGLVLVSEAGEERAPAGFASDGVVLVWRAGGAFLWVPVLRDRFPVGARVTGPVGQWGRVTSPPVGEVRPWVVGPWWPSGGALEGSHVWVVVDGEASGVWVPVSHLG